MKSDKNKIKGAEARILFSK